MKTLALDTSERSQSVAILVDSQVRCEIFHPFTTTHSETLLVSIQEVLKKSELSLTDLDLFAITVGPGSFTGLRIGLSTLKAFALIHARPIAGVSTLLALATPYRKGHPLVVSCMTSRRGEFYVAAYQGGQAGIDNGILLPPQAMEEKSFIESMEQIPGEKLIVGSGIRISPSCLSSVPGAYTLDPEEGHRVRASVVGQLGEILHNQGETLQGEELRPAYLKTSEAERRLRQENSKSETNSKS